MLQLCKRALRPFTAATVAGVTLAMVLASSGAAGAGTLRSAPQPSQAAVGAAAPVAAPVLSNGALQATSSVFGHLAGVDTTLVRGTFTPVLFKVTDTGKMVVKGTLRTTIKDSVTKTVLKRGSQWVTLPVGQVNGNPTAAGAARGQSAAAAALPPCPILNLVLGPLHLDLLGLVVDLNKVILNIVAQPGPGNLLGNLLCAVAHLLDGTPAPSVSQLTDLLNSILAILRS